MTAIIVVWAVLSPLAAIMVLRRREWGPAGWRAVLFSTRRVNVAAYILLPLLTVGLYLRQGVPDWPLDLLHSCLLIFFGFIVAADDYRAKTIPNTYVLAMGAAWMLTMTPPLFFQTDMAVKRLTGALLGALLGGGLFLLVYMISKKGLGGGDVKFMAAAGLFLTAGQVLAAMLYGTVLAAVTGLVLLAAKRIGRKDSMPLAPFLYAGILIVRFL